MKISILLILIFLYGPLGSVRADYAQEIRDQIAEIKTASAKNFGMEYFHDMGIIARKADDAEVKDLQVEIIRGLLLKRMEEYISAQLKEIDEQFAVDPRAASKRIPELMRFERFYQPSEEFLKTADGQAINAEVASARNEALHRLQIGCDIDTLEAGIAAIRKTGLFITSQSDEGTKLQTLVLETEACLNWKPEIRYTHTQPFKNDYEEGTLTENAVLRLESSRQDRVQAKWAGHWDYKFTGKEGAGEATSQGILSYTRGEETAQLTISPGKVSSSGRMNFPMSFPGESRTLEVSQGHILPRLYFSKATSAVAVTGSHDEKKKADTDQ